MHVHVLWQNLGLLSSTRKLHRDTAVALNAQMVQGLLLISKRGLKGSVQQDCQIKNCCISRHCAEVYIPYLMPFSNCFKGDSCIFISSFHKNRLAEGVHDLSIDFNTCSVFPFTGNSCSYFIGFFFYSREVLWPENLNTRKVESNDFLLSIILREM